MHGFDEGIPFLRAATDFFRGLAVQILDQFSFTLALFGVTGTTVFAVAGRRRLLVG